MPFITTWDDSRNQNHPTDSAEEARKVAAEKLVRAVIHEDGGPLIHNGWEDEQRTFDSTCRKFYRFLTQSQR